MWTFSAAVCHRNKGQCSLVYKTPIHLLARRQFGRRRCGVAGQGAVLSGLCACVGAACGGRGGFAGVCARVGSVCAARTRVRMNVVEGRRSAGLVEHRTLCLGLCRGLVERHTPSAERGPYPCQAAHRNISAAEPAQPHSRLGGDTGCARALWACGCCCPRGVCASCQVSVVDTLAHVRIELLGQRSPISFSSRLQSSPCSRVARTVRLENLSCASVSPAKQQRSSAYRSCAW
jgi:hypothetical protein